MSFFNSQLLDAFSNLKSSVNGYSPFKAIKGGSDNCSLTLTRPPIIEETLCVGITSKYFNNALGNQDGIRRNIINKLTTVGNLVSKIPGVTPLVNTTHSVLSRVPVVRNLLGSQSNVVFLMKGSICIGFMVIKKGECVSKPEWWSLSLICSQSGSGGGTVLLGLYLFIIYRNNLNDGNGILDLANGIYNIGAFCAYDKLGFQAAEHQYFFDCFQLGDGWLMNLPMICNISKHYKSDIAIIDAVTGDKPLKKNRLCNREMIETITTGQNKQDAELISTAYMICEHFLIMIDVMNSVNDDNGLSRLRKYQVAAFGKSGSSRASRATKVSQNYDIKFDSIKMSVKTFGPEQIVYAFNKLSERISQSRQSGSVSTNYLYDFKSAIEATQSDPEKLKELVLPLPKRSSKTSGGRGMRPPHRTRCKTLRRRIKNRKTRKIY